MARSTSFGFTNVSGNTHSVTPTKLGLTSNYALNFEDANNAVLNNKTAPIDAEELITFRSRNVAQVNTDLNIQNPSKVKGGVQYQAQVEAILTTTDSDDPTFRVDEPMLALLTIRHPKSGNITSTHVATLVERLIGSVFKEDGTWRFDDLMRGAERPIAD